MRDEGKIVRDVVLGLLIAIILLIVILPKPKGKIDEGAAPKFVLDDLHHKYPNANISILEVQEKRNKNNETYYMVKAKVVLDPNTPCPKRMHIYYNYPEQNFVPQPPDIITSKSCKICGTGICTIIYPEEAIIGSHTLKGTEDVEQFLEEYPASFPKVKEENTNKGKVWNVNWTNKDKWIDVVLSMNGTCINITKGS